MNPDIFLICSPEWKKSMCNKSDNVWMVNPDTFESDDVAKSCPVSYQTINQYTGTTCRSSFSRVNWDTNRCMWTGEFDLDIICGWEKCWSHKEIAQKYLDMCGRALEWLACVTHWFQSMLKHTVCNLRLFFFCIIVYNNKILLFFNFQESSLSQNIYFFWPYLQVSRYTCM